jgi:acyl carrier protein
MDEKILDRVRNMISNLMQVPLEDVLVSSSPGTIKAWDSLQHLNLILSLEETFGLQFAPEETTELLSVETIVLMVEEKLTAK